MGSSRVLLEISISTVNISQFFEKWFHYVISVTKWEKYRAVDMPGRREPITNRPPTATSLASPARGWDKLTVQLALI